MHFRSVFLTIALLSSGCGVNEALFVTSTTIGLNADATQQNLVIAYDRYEGFVGPVDDNGNAPPAVAFISSNQSTSNPRVKQLYATGLAALDVTVGETGANLRRAEMAKAENQKNVIDENRRVAFFAVAQTTGLKIKFSPATVVDHVLVGYNRKEASFLPLVENEKKEASYPSTFASISRNVDIKALGDTTDGVTQFFATGSAARNIALRKDVRAYFNLIGAGAVRDNVKLTDLYLSDAEAKKRLDDWVAAQGDPKCTDFTAVELLKDCESLRNKMIDENPVASLIGSGS